MPSAGESLADRLDALLPQTQCTRCGYPDCRAYAEALVAGEADLNQCPPGGAEGVRRLARALGRPPLPLSPAHGLEGPRHVVFIDEPACIGCTLCIQACPVDAIVGAAKRMHGVIESVCTGCELCLPACPVDCIRVEDAPAFVDVPIPGFAAGDAGAAARAGTSTASAATHRDEGSTRQPGTPISPRATGWDAWSPAQADEARARYARRQRRLAGDRLAADARHPDADMPPAAAQETPIDPKRAAIEAALARARLRAKMRPT